MLEENDYYAALGMDESGEKEQEAAEPVEQSESQAQQTGEQAQEVAEPAQTSQPEAMSLQERRQNAGTTVVVPGRAEIAALRRRKSPKLSKRTRAKRSGASSLCCGKTEASHKEAEQTNSARRKNARLSAPLALTAVSAATAAVRLPASGTHIAALPVPGLHRDSRTIPALAVRPLLPQVVYSRCSVYRAFCTENPWTKLRMSFQYPTPRSPYS